MTHADAVEALGKEMTDERTELFIAHPKKPNSYSTRK
jgi:hypothetical protein